MLSPAAISERVYLMGIQTTPHPCCPTLHTTRPSGCGGRVAPARPPSLRLAFTPTLNHSVSRDLGTAPHMPPPFDNGLRAGSRAERGSNCSAPCTSLYVGRGVVTSQRGTQVLANPHPKPSISLAQTGSQRKGLGIRFFCPYGVGPRPANDRLQVRPCLLRCYIIRYYTSHAAKSPKEPPPGI